MRHNNSALAFWLLVMLLWLLVVTFCTPTFAADRKTEELLVITSAATDFATTEYALQHGLSEANPLAQKRAARVVLKAAQCTLVILLARSLENDGHPRAASLLRTVSLGFGFGATAWNVHAIIRWGN